MNRPLFAWFLFGICLLATTSAVGWLTHSAWRADQARQQALLDSEIRNALWRMDSLVAPLLAIEINRPTLAAPLTNTPMLAPKLVKGYVVGDALGHWTIRRNGRVTKREVLAADCPLVGENWAARLGTTGPMNGSAVVAAVDSTATTVPNDLIIWPDAASQGQGGQMLRNTVTGVEAQNRNQLVQQFQQIAANSQQQPASGDFHVASRFTPLQPVWVGEELVLARQIPDLKGSAVIVIEVCWLNWKEWEALLSAQLEEASIPLQLRPCDSNLAQPVETQAGRWQLVSLPIRLEPKSTRMPDPWPLPLIAVWGLLLIVAIAFGWLMRQTLNLSERRAAFVSAVTHELRTPLTTFRLYTEMLSEGMASDPQQQQIYFRTLNREANRLTHLVENVLAYARLEHGRSTARNETLTIGDLFDRCSPRLEQRVAETPLSLSFQIPESAQAATLTTNAMAVEQILFNLIDNSCKYARDAADPKIVCDVQIERDRVCVRLSDFGPGLSSTARKSLFQPFQKSSSQAAESAPGVGLGLALSHRLARDLRGSLQCHPNAPTGLCFELHLPLTGLPNKGG